MLGTPYFHDSYPLLIIPPVVRLPRPRAAVPAGTNVCAACLAHNLDQAQCNSSNGLEDRTVFENL